MSLGRPSRAVVDDKERLFQCLEGLYEAINSNRTSITELSNRFTSVTDASTTINVGAATSVAVSPLDSDREDGGGGSDGPAPGASTSTNMARVWVSTPDTSFPYGVNMGALASGMLSHVVTAGVSVPSVFVATATRIPFGSGVDGALTDSGNFTYDDATGTVLVGLTSGSAVVGVTMEVFRNQNQGTQFVFANSSAGAAAYAAFQLGQSSNLATGSYFGLTLYGSGSTFGNPITASTGMIELGGGSSNMHFWVDQNVGDFVWYTKAIYPNPPERMRLATDGVFVVGGVAGGLPGGTMAQFRRTQNSASYLIVSNASAGTAAESGMILSQSETGYSNYLYFSMLGSGYTTFGPYQASGAAFEHVTNTTAPMFFSAYGGQPIDFYTTTSRTLRFKIHNAGTVEVVNQLHVDVGADQVWKNLGVVGAGTYEQVRAFWSSNTWVLATESAGGTERNMIIGNASNATVAVTSGTGAYLVGGSVGSAPIVAASSLSIAISPVGITRARAAGATLDAVSVVGNTVQVTGAAGVNITTALGFNYIKIEPPTLTGLGNATTISTSATMALTGAPTGTNGVTITTPLTLWVQAGATRLDGNATCAGSGANLGFFGSNGAAQATSGANLTNNVTSGGTDNVIDNWTDLSTYGTDAEAIRNAVYQLARKLKQINDGLRTYNLLT